MKREPNFITLFQSLYYLTHLTTKKTCENILKKTCENILTKICENILKKACENILTKDSLSVFHLSEIINLFSRFEIQRSLNVRV